GRADRRQPRGPARRNRRPVLAARPGAGAPLGAGLGRGRRRLADAGTRRARRARVPVARSLPGGDRVRPAAPRRMPRGAGHGVARGRAMTPDDRDGIVEQLQAVLAEDTQNGERLLGRLELLRQETGLGAHAALLLVLTHLRLEDDEARKVWDEALAHRHEMSLALGRDVGVRVALFDYFVNVNRRLVRPTLIDLEMFEADRSGSPVDRTTGLATDRAFRSAVQAELRRAKRYAQRVAVVLFDLDGFAAVNERVGSAVADRLLRETAILLHNKVRDIDLAARPGEDEMALVLPETDRNGAHLVAERFRREVEVHFHRREAGGKPVGLTVSGGVASYPEDARTAEALIERAAQALYAAKASG